jgi:hypothetical protein
MVECIKNFYFNADTIFESSRLLSSRPSSKDFEAVIRLDPLGDSANNRIR